MKYQFCIRFHDVDVNSAASKAVLDCNAIFSRRGYVDHTVTVGDNKRKIFYYLLLLKSLVGFFLSVKRGSLIGIQYPLLSINDVFKRFIKLARFKKARVFCIVHDLESLRKGGNDAAMISKEIDNLNAYDMIIVHNLRMQVWLEQNGLTCQVVLLEIFDYLSGEQTTERPNSPLDPIVYAGNLSKSTFIYDLQQIKKSFNIYGPNFRVDECPENVTWRGVFSPEEIPMQLTGSFGLIWDGENIANVDDNLGNYLRYNNPHKASLYIAAGLPLIAPSSSAIGDFILRTGTGFVISSLVDLDSISVDAGIHNEMLANVKKIQTMVLKGSYFEKALDKVELLCRQQTAKKR